MPKRYFKIVDISKAEYFKQAEAAGKPENQLAVERSVSGSMNTAPKTWLAYTEEETLEVTVGESEDK